MGSLNRTLTRVVVPSAVAAAVLLGTAGTATARTEHRDGSGVGNAADSDYDEDLPTGMSRAHGGNSGIVCLALFRTIV